jgi:Fe-S cluster assembly protein SufD
MDAYAEAFRRFSGNGGGEGPPGLVARRRDAFERFARAGFPTPKDEEWRFTPLGPITSRIWRMAGAESHGLTDAHLAPFRFGPSEWATLVFVNGRYSAALSHRPVMPDGVTLETLTEAMARDAALVEGAFPAPSGSDPTPFAALNAAFAQEGAVVRVEAGREVPQPIHLLFVATAEAEGLAIQPRTLVVVAAGARAQVVESYVGLGTGASFTNAVTKVAVGPGAWVEHSRIQRESEAACHVGLTEVAQERDSHYRSFTLAMGGRVARHDLRARLNDANIETLLYGLYLGRDEQLVDNHTAIFHDHPNCRSWEVYKGILDGASHGVFNGKVFVRPEAQKTDAKQTNRNLLLSDRARVDTKPQLEIFADDVKCTHGATVGRLDETAYFYLQSRGLPRAEAQRLLTYAFAAEVVDEVAAPAVREALDRLVHARLAEVA